MYHANVLIGTKEWALAQIPESEKTPGLDVVFKVSERMSIDDTRALVHETQLRPVVRPYRVFIIITNDILPPAQNALLKLFEEPNDTTVFYLIIPRVDILLPTLRSRVQVLGEEREGDSETAAFVAFQKAGYEKRLTLIAEKLQEEDFAWVTELVRGLEQYAHTTRNVVLMRDTLVLLSRITTPGSSKKMLLEHIALSL